MFCGNCGREIENSAGFCPYCGKPVQGNRKDQIYRPPEKQRKNIKERRIKKGLIITAIVSLLIIMAAGAIFILGKYYKVSKDEDVSVESDTGTETEAIIEQKMDIYGAYYEKLKELQQDYGVGKIAEIHFEDEFSFVDWKGEYLSGLCFAKLEDFNADGQEELITVYLDSQNKVYDNATAITDYVVEVWKYQDFECKKIYKGTLYTPHQGLSNEAFFLTNIDGIPYLVQGGNDIIYCFWGYGSKGFAEVKTLEKDWVENTGYKIDGANVSKSEYDAEFARWWENCEAYLMVNFSNPNLENRYIDSEIMKAEKLAFMGNLQDTLSELENVLQIVSDKADIGEDSELYGGEDSTETKQSEREENQEEIQSDTEDEKIETVVGVQQVNMSCISAIEATSELSESTVVHSAGRLCDGDIGTAWVEGVSGQGIGESISVEFDDTYSVAGIKIYAGYQKTSDLYYQNSRPSELEIKLSDGALFKCYLEDFCGEQIVQFPEVRETSRIEITIKNVYAGSQYEDTCISEIEVY